MKTQFLLLVTSAAASVMLCSCAGEYNYRTSDSLALLRANDESVHGMSGFSGETAEARMYSGRASASLQGLQSATGWR